MALNRRAILRGAAASTVLATSPSVSARAEAGVASLRQVASQAGLRYGAVSDVEFSKAPPDYVELFVHNCDLLASLTPWNRTAPRQFDPDPSWEDPNMMFAREHGMQLTGCHLLWHDSTPAWFEHLPSRSAAEAAIARHIEAMTTRYSPRTYSWNVVNEAIEPRDGRPDGLKECQLLRKLGPDYITTAFRLARQSAPHALLVYNEYGLESPKAYAESRRIALLRLLDKLQSANAPIDAVGLQSHLRLAGPNAFDQHRYRAFLHELAGRGLAIIISELDVLDVEFTPSIAARDADVAALYTLFLDTALDERAVIAVVTWGLSDRYSWYNLWHDRSFTRWDHQPTRPLLFDDTFHPKPAFEAVLAAFRRAPARPPNRVN